MVRVLLRSNTARFSTVKNQFLHRSRARAGAFQAEQRHADASRSKPSIGKSLAMHRPCPASISSIWSIWRAYILSLQQKVFTSGASAAWWISFVIEPQRFLEKLIRRRCARRAKILKASTVSHKKGK